MISNPQKLANIQNDHFFSKIDKIRKGFTKPEFEPIELLKMLRPRINKTFVLPPITVPQVIQLINSLKPSNSTGWDYVSNKTIKKIKYQIAPHICHLFNCIIHQRVFPHVFKLSKILPLIKPGKNALFADSY